MNYRCYLLPCRRPRSSLPESVKAFEEVATGKLLASPQWRCALTIHNMIARVHDIDSGLSCVTRAMRHTSPETKRRYQLGMVEQVREAIAFVSGEASIQVQ
jgi:hypothetical protein